MSHDIRLTDPESGETLEMDAPFTDGGTHTIGGTHECYLNVTYNYRLGPLLGLLCGSHSNAVKGEPMTGAQSLSLLNDAISLLPDESPDADYWANTPGNRRAALMRLRAFAMAHPQGVWYGV